MYISSYPIKAQNCICIVKTFKMFSHITNSNFLPSLPPPLPLILLTVCRNLCSLFAHCMEKYMLSSCLLYEGISALFLLTASRNKSSHPANYVEECPLIAWKNICSKPAHWREECLLCLLHGEIPALILLNIWRNVCSLPAHCSKEIPALILLTIRRNLCTLPAHWMKKYLL